MILSGGCRCPESSWQRIGTNALGAIVCSEKVTGSNGSIHKPGLRIRSPTPIALISFLRRNKVFECFRVCGLFVNYLWWCFVLWIRLVVSESEHSFFWDDKVSWPANPELLLLFTRHILGWTNRGESWELLRLVYMGQVSGYAVASITSPPTNISSL